MRNLKSRGMKLDPNKTALTSQIGFYICINDHMLREGDFEKTAIIPCCPVCSAQGKKQVILRPLSLA